MNRVSLVALTFVLAGSILLGVVETDPGRAYPGGAEDQRHDPVTCELCHEPTTAGNVTVELDNEMVEPNEVLKITIRINIPGLGSDNIVGVFILDGDSGEVPSPLAWSVVEDPNGGTSYYVEKPGSGSGSPTEFVWSVRAPWTEGNHTLMARALYGESEPSSYIVSEPVTVEVKRTGTGPGPMPEPVPELELREIEIPDDLHAGEEVEIRALVANTGNITALDVTVQFFDRSVEDPDLSQLGWARHVVVAPKQEVWVRIWWTPAAKGTANIEVVVDPEVRFNELDRSNNRLTASANIGPTVEEAFFTSDKFTAMWPQLLLIVVAHMIPIMWALAGRVQGGRKRRNKVAKKKKDKGSGGDD